MAKKVTVTEVELQNKKRKNSKIRKPLDDGTSCYWNGKSTQTALIYDHRV